MVYNRAELEAKNQAMAEKSAAAKANRATGGGKNSITTKYGTKINVSGLSPEQIARVRSMAEDNGAYGAKGAALANSLRKRGTGGANAGDMAGATEDNVSLGINDINKGNGVFDNPDDVWANAPKIPGADDLQGEVDKVRDANYNYITKDYATSKAREIEDKKQELAERGIPMDPDPNSLYGRSLAEIDKHYQSLDDQARNQAIIGGDATLTTQVNAGKTANDAFMNAVLGMSDRELALYGLNKNFKAQMAQIKAQKNTGGGGGGGGGGTPDTSPIIGGSAPGFGV